MLGIVSLGVNTASANVGAGAAFDAHYVNNSNCQTCHSGAPGTLYTLGTNWKNAGGTSQAGPTTQTGWDTLDASHSVAYGGVEPGWTLASSSSATTQSQASTTGCVTSSMATPAILLGMLMVLGLTIRRKQEVKVTRN